MSQTEKFMINFFRRLWARFLTLIQKKKFEKMYKKTEQLGFIQQFIEMDTEVMWEKPHPNHQERLTQYKKNLKGEESDTVAFGDSLLDGDKFKFWSIPEEFNFAIGGSWANHNIDMIRDIVPVLKRNNQFNSIKYVVIGCLGGNPFLCKQPANITISQSITALNVAREEFPGRKLIIYGLPPTVFWYLNTQAMEFEAAIYNWIRADQNSVFLPLLKKFSKTGLGLFPKTIMSMEGVHHTPIGRVEFDILIAKGKKKKPLSIVD